MIERDDLFELIRSLTQGEKRHFKLFTSRQAGDKNYLRLFELLEKQKQYNEEKIIKQFAKQKFKGQLSAVKNYLQHLILSSLESYFANESVHIKLKHQLLQIQILKQKGLLNQCEKLIRRSKQLAYKHEEFLVLAELIEWESIVEERKAFMGVNEKKLDDTLKQTKVVLDKYKNLQEYSTIHRKVAIRAYKKGVIRSSDDLSDVEGLLKHPLLKNENKATSIKSMYYFYLTSKNSSEASYAFNKAFSYSQKIIQLLEANPHKIADNPNQYIYSVNNHINILLHLHRFNEAPVYIRKLKELSNTLNTGEVDMKHRIIYMTSIVEIVLYCETGAFNLAVEIVKKLNEDINKQHMNLYLLERSSLYFCGACAYFGIEDFSSSKKYLNKILHESIIKDIPEDTICAARIINLIVHYELGEEDTLPHIIRSTYRFLSKRKQLYKVESLLLGFMKTTMWKINSKKQLMECFRQMKVQIIQICSDPFEKKALDYFDYISWLKSKIENRPFSEIMREKAKRPTLNKR